MTTFSFKSIDVSAPISSDPYVSVSGVDAAGEAVGSYGYTDGDGDSYFHGFTATGTVGTTFDPPGSSNTNGIGITAGGEIFGDYVDQFNRQHGFVDINGVFQQIDVSLASSTVVDGVTNAGTIFGTYVDEFGSGIHGFIDSNGSFTTLDVPGASATSISGINAAGEIVGSYTDTSGRGHGFADISGTFATIDPAGSISTSLVGVSAGGEVAGNYENSSSVNNGFVDNNGVITTIVIPGATDTGVSAINSAGEVVGYYADSLGNVHGFINQNGVTTTLDVPGATETDIYGVNDSGVISGFYDDSSYTQHGFVGVPVVPNGIVVSGVTSDVLQGGPPGTLLTGATITDSGKTNLASATIKIANGSGNSVAGDELYVDGQQSGALGNGVTASWSGATGTLTLTGSATLAVYDALLGEVTYQDGGTDSSTSGHPGRTVTWTVNDGTSSFGTTSQIAVDRSPVAGSDAGTDVAGTTLTVSAVGGVLSNDTDLDGDPLTVTGVSDSAHGAGMLAQPLAGAYGHLTLNPNGGYSYVADMTSAINSAPTGSHPQDVFNYTVSDGKGGSASAVLDITLDRPPLVTTSNLTEWPSQMLAASSLFTAIDPDGAPITEYEFWDSTRDPNSGHFYLNGAQQAAGTIIEVSASRLGQLTFATGTDGNALQVRAFDGVSWSASDTAAWAPFSLGISAPPPPVVTTSNLTESPDQTLMASSLFGVTDPGGKPITAYEFWDSTRDPNSGHFYLNGAEQAPGTIIEVSASQLGQLTFLTGTVSNALQVRAFDGSNWSAGDAAAWAPFNVNIAAAPPPVVTTANFSTPPNQTFAAASLFAVTDPGGKPITEYEFWDSTRDPNSGHFYLNGAEQAPGTIIEVPASQLSKLTFVTGTVSNALQVRAFDGSNWSAGDTAAWAPFSVTAAAVPATIGAGQTLELGSLFSGTVSFAGATGTLKIDNSSSFSGKIAGQLAIGDVLDLADVTAGAGATIGYSGNNSPGTLTVGDGTRTASIALTGNYSLANFTVASDGHGGTSVVDPPLPGRQGGAAPSEEAAGPQGGLNQQMALLSQTLASFAPSDWGGGGTPNAPLAYESGQQSSLAQPIASQQHA
jgi:VCBS repeat-containing protein